MKVKYKAKKSAMMIRKGKIFFMIIVFRHNYLAGVFQMQNFMYKIKRHGKYNIYGREIRRW